MTGLEWLLTFLLSFEGSLRANAVSESRQRKLQAEADEKAKLLTAFGNARSLRDAIKAIATDVARLKVQIGMAPQEGPLFQLLLDETFQEDLANWLSASDPAQDSRLGSIVLERMACALESGGAAPAEIQRFREEYIGRFQTELFRNTTLAQWRLDLRVASLQTQIASESAATRAIVREQSAALQAAIARLTPGYEADIEQLRKRTQLVLESLSRTASIHICGQDLKIPRVSVGAIGAAACDGHVIVVGDPGAGKSVGIYDLAASLQDEGTDIVVIDVQRTTADSVGALQAEFGLSHDLIDVLEHWSGPGYGYLIIDALDAARSAEAVATFNDLVARCTTRLPNWRVVVSVRKYDLRYNPDIQRLFRGVPPSQFADAEFQSVRHVNISVFSDDELEAIGQGSAELAELVHAAEPALRTLLRNPFNLRLLAELLDEGAVVAELTPIRTQIDLLDRYWQARIIRSDRRGDAREGLLRRAAETMSAAMSLRIDRAALAVDAAASEPLHGLLSSNVLMEWQDAPGSALERYILTFSHNIIFDYAVERLLLRGDPAALAHRLASEPDLILAIRPSIAFHFHHLWSRDVQHQAFWKTVLDLLGADGVPRIAQLVGPSVTTELASSIDDFSLLFTALGSDNDRTRANAELAVSDIVGALLASRVSLVSPQGRLWCEWAGQLADHISNATARPLRALLASIDWHD